REEAARTHIRRFSELTDDELRGMLLELAASAAEMVTAEGVSRAERAGPYHADIRYHGQGCEIAVRVDRGAVDGAGGGLRALGAAGDAEHRRLFSLPLRSEHELVSMRAAVSGPPPHVAATVLPDGGPDRGHARTGTPPVHVDGAPAQAAVYDRGRLLAGNVITGPAIATEMDSTTLVLPGHAATVHPSGCLLIRPIASEEV